MLHGSIDRNGRSVFVEEVNEPVNNAMFNDELARKYVKQIINAFPEPDVRKRILKIANMDEPIDITEGKEYFVE